MPKKSIKLVFEENQYNYLKQVARKNFLTLSVLIKIAVIEYMKKLEGEKMIDVFYQKRKSGIKNT
ncbi:hypothetical protein V6M85_13555 [Sulfolobus tengchongensis]|uniref:CopG family transcriptional regulator n=1 Tax=Sulfolobus tengchongensis TaxID=207809 RepID=A0AAX4L0R0_9CREN